MALSSPSPSKGQRGVFETSGAPGLTLHVVITRVSASTWKGKPHGHASGSTSPCWALWGAGDRIVSRGRKTGLPGGGSLRTEAWTLCGMGSSGLGHEGARDSLPSQG